MKIIKINEDGLVESPYVTDASIKLEVKDEIYEMLTSCKIGMNWKYINNEFIMIEILDANVIRFRRNSECFSIIDSRSQLWWTHLSESQKEELTSWYEDWLVAPETKIIPKKPTWLN